MICADLPDDAGFDEWRAAARPLLAADVRPWDIAWRASESGGLFQDAEVNHAPMTSVRLPAAFLDMANDAACHRDGNRFDLLYRVAWRLKRDLRLIADRSDADMSRLHRMAVGVRRETHKMHAYVRFRHSSDGGDDSFVAWYEPLHLVVRKAAPFFAERFPSSSWSIITPAVSAHWNRVALTFGPGGQRSDVPDADETERGWRVYYESVFNPARLNVPVMTRHMPRRFWANMPEAATIPDLVRKAGERTSAMIGSAPTMARKRLGKAERDATAELCDDAMTSLADVERNVLGCRRCPLWRDATQAVPGEGPASAGIMLVGEQPGDQEDLAGRPFVGPAGAVLDRALEKAGVDRDKLFVTNAVKHFKYEMRGKRRLHRKPDAGEVQACAFWLAHERKLVGPAVIVALGATALSSLKGPKATLKVYRGVLGEAEPDGARVIATYHPSYILRVPDEAAKSAAFDALVSDLRVAAKAAA